VGAAATAVALPGTGLATSWQASALAPEDWLVGAFLASTRTPNTRQAYARDIADWRGWLAERGVGLLGASRVVVDLYARHAGEVRAHSPATVARRLSALTRLYRYAVAVELLERNPLEGVDRPRAVRTPPAPAWTGASWPPSSPQPAPAPTGTTP